jgi:lysophospholipase L1-like esterase
MHRQRANVLLSLFAFLAALLVVEIGLRTYLATRMGISILWYGTRYNRQEIKGMHERERWAAEGDPRALRGAGDEHHTVRQHQNSAEGYSKFFPGETKYTYDTDTAEVIPVHINGHGFRGDDYEIAKDPGVIRIVALGASSTFGYHDRDDETYPYYLQRLLSASCASRRFEVINLGVPHLTSGEILELFRKEAVPLQPDIVTFYEGINDSSFDKSETKAAWRQSLAAAYRGIRDHVVIAAFVQEILNSGSRRFSPDDVARHRRGRSDTFLGNLSQLLDACRSTGATLIVANQQARSLLVPRQELNAVSYAQEIALVERKLREESAINTKELNFLTHGDLMRDLEKWATANAVDFVDVIGALDSHRETLVSWVHLNAEGNRMVAAALADDILPRVCAGSVELRPAAVSY